MQSRLNLDTKTIFYSLATIYYALFIMQLFIHSIHYATIYYIRNYLLWMILELHATERVQHRNLANKIQNLGFSIW